MRTMAEGGGGEISLNPDELQRFAERAQSIGDLFQNRIRPEIERLSGLGYYAQGEAADAFAHYRQALEKMMDAGDFYYRAAQILALTAEIMSGQDEALAAAINEGR